MKHRSCQKRWDVFTGQGPLLHPLWLAFARQTFQSQGISSRVLQSNLRLLRKTKSKKIRQSCVQSQGEGAFPEVS